MVVVRGDVVMSGYWNMPEATASTLVDGWLHTGDIGIFDDNGLLSLIDRAKEVIISGGLNIYPREVEEVLLSHPDVAEVSVVGLPDRRMGRDHGCSRGRPGGTDDRAQKNWTSFVSTISRASSGRRNISLWMNCPKARMGRY